MHYFFLTVCICDRFRHSLLQLQLLSESLCKLCVQVCSNFSRWLEFDIQAVELLNENTIFSAKRRWEKEYFSCVILNNDFSSEIYRRINVVPLIMKLSMVNNICCHGAKCCLMVLAGRAGYRNITASETLEMCWCYLPYVYPAQRNNAVFQSFFWLLWITKISSVKLHSCRCSFSGKVLALAASCRLKGNTVKTCCFLPFCTQTALHSWSYYKGFQLFANIGNTNVLHLDKEVQTPDLTLGLGLEGRGFFQGVLINQICLMEVITVENLVLLRYF